MSLSDVARTATAGAPNRDSCPKNRPSDRPTIRIRSGQGLGGDRLKVWRVSSTDFGEVKVEDLGGAGGTGVTSNLGSICDVVHFLLGALMVVVLACSSHPTPAPTEKPVSILEGPNVSEIKTEVVVHYADGVHTLYSKSLSSATTMDTAIDTFIADPTPATLEGAKRAWLIARDDYGPTEVSQFYGGPIGNEWVGPEGLINA